MKHATLSILAALLVTTAQFARAENLADAFLFRPEAPRLETERSVEAVPEDLRRANSYEARPDYPVASHGKDASPVPASQDERAGDPIYRGFPAHVIGAH